ncbi:hypothetical protein ACXR8F_20730 [Terrabacter sp. AAH1]
MTNRSLVGACLARMACERDGLMAVYLPSGVDRLIGQSIVWEANNIRRSEPPFCVFVSNAAHEPDASMPVVDRAESIKFRQGNRLAVVDSTSVDLASFDGAFREVVGPGFPATAVTGFDVETLSRTATCLLLELGGLEAADVDLPACSSLLAKCLTQIANVFAEEQDGAVAWNAAWFRAADRGLLRLAEAIRAEATGTGDRTFDELVHDLVWPCFALPTPDAGTDWSKRHTFADFVGAYGDLWSSEESVYLHTREALLNLGDSARPLENCEKIGWDGLSESVARNGSPFLALQEIATASTKLLEAFAGVRESLFFPVNVQQDLDVRGEGGSVINVGPSHSSPLRLASSAPSADGRLASEELWAIASPRLEPPPSAVIASRIHLKANGGARVIEEGRPELQDGKIGFRFRLEMPAKPEFKLRKIAISLEVAADDPLYGYLRDAVVPVYVTPPTRSALVLCPWSSRTRKNFKTPSYVGQESASDVEDQYDAELPFNVAFRVVVKAPVAPVSDNVSLAPVPNREDWFVAELPANSPATIRAGEFTWTLSNVGPSEAPQSLLLAAIAHVPVAPEDPDALVVESFRGQFESLLSARAEDGAFQDLLGHVVLGVDVVSGFDEVSRHRGLLMPATVRKAWDDRVNKAAVPSEAVLDARSNFVAVWRRCLDRLVPVSDFTSGGWPSKRTMAALAADPRLLAELLASYTRMMESADASRDALVRFQCAYPFSASVWNLTGTGGGCAAVLLSPWHPIRLAWLAEAEGALQAAERAQELSGVLEGWQFPLVAPAPSPVGRMVSVPIDAGEGQVFAGWSLMVRLSTDEAQPLTIPTRAAGLRLPGSSASGLSGSAVDAAVRDFRRMNSHLPTVTVDLASSASGPRLRDLDSSVIRAASTWAASAAPVRGVRVMDSLNRAGDLPREELAEMLHTASPSVVTWSRYEDRPDARPLSNLRILQDSGVKARLELYADARAGGVVGPRPLRRFEAPAATHAGSESYVEPGLADVDSPFALAIRALEGANQPPRLGLELAVSQLVDTRAEWTISGEAFISPSALARQLGSDNPVDKRMLWEWRPPFLRPEKGEAPLNRRPYLSVSKVSRALIERVTDQIAGIAGEETAPAIANDVFHALGSQGIGLSSLLTMGGHHASGALGFYLALRLSKLAAPQENTLRVVMPLDACQSFLEVLAPDVAAGEVKKRADLLVISMCEDQLTISPVEIKFYGSNGQGGALKTPGADFAEPLSQLEATMDCLRSMQHERARLRDEHLDADAALWDNALTTLVEAALRLATPSSSEGFERARMTLHRLVRGDYAIRLGRPLIMFFNHQSNAVDDFAVYYEGRPAAHDPMAAYGALSARPAAALKAVSGPELGDANSAMVSSWSDLLAWSEQNAVGQVLETLDEDGEEGSPLTPEELPEESVVPRLDSVPLDSPETVTSDIDPVSSGVQRDLTVTEGPSEASEGGAAAAIQHGVRFPVGSFIGALGSGLAEYWPGNTETTQLNMGIVGDLGTGKTQLLKALLLNLRRQARAAQATPVSGLVFDYKKDFQGADFAASVGATVWQPTNMPLNVLELHGEYTAPAAYRRAASFTTMLQRIYSGIGPVQRDKLISTIMGLFKDHGGLAPTLAEVLDRYGDASKPDSVTSVLNAFVLGQVFSEDRHSLVSLDEAMDDTVLVIGLNSLGADTYTKNAIVVLFLEMFYESMKRRGPLAPRITPEGETLRTLTSYLLVDEASNIMQYGFEVLQSLLKEGREFGVGTILSSQYLSHFFQGGVNYAETLSTWFIHKVPNATKSELSSLGIPGASPEMAERIKSLHVHESLYRSDLSPARFIRDIPFWRLVRESEEGNY